MIIFNLAVNLLKQEKTIEEHVQAKRLQIGWSEDYIPKVLAGRTAIALVFDCL